MLADVLALADYEHLQFSGDFDDAVKLLDTCQRMNLEGIVSKRRDSAYRSGPTRDWLKIKTATWRAATVIAVRCFDNAETCWLRPPILALAALTFGHHKSEHEPVPRPLPVDRTNYRSGFLDLSRTAQQCRRELFHRAPADCSRAEYAAADVIARRCRFAPALPCQKRKSGSYRWRKRGIWWVGLATVSKKHDERQHGVEELLRILPPVQAHPLGDELGDERAAQLRDVLGESSETFRQAFKRS